MGLTIIRPDTHIDFIGARKKALVVSIALILIGLVALVAQGGPRYGIDFAGGLVVQVEFDAGVTSDAIKDALDTTTLPDPVVQNFGGAEGNDYLVRISDVGITSATVRSEMENAFANQLTNSTYEIKRLEMVGPKVGADLRSKALEALFYAVLIIAIYISGRFEQKWFAAGFIAVALAGGIYVFKLIGLPMGALILMALALSMVLCWYLRLNYALGAVVALLHDVIITVGILTLLGREFDLNIIAALLTIVGYSLNDTIIIFDRIRENLHAQRKKKVLDLPALLNTSINQTLSRTILTSGTTLVVVLCLYIFGGGVIHDFALALLIGVSVGTYSSIFVASPILLGFGIRPPRNPEEDAEAVEATA